MNDYYPVNNIKPSPFSEMLMNSVSHLDLKTAIVFGGMFCITVMFCFGSVVFSGSELHLSRNGVSITQPSKDKNIGCCNETSER